MCPGSAYPAFSYEFPWKWYGTRPPAGILLQSLFPPLLSMRTFAVNRGFIWQQFTHFSDCGKVLLSYRFIKWTCKHIDFFLSFPTSVFSCLSVIVTSIWTLVLPVGKQFMLNSWGYLHEEFVSRILINMTETLNNKTLKYLLMFYQVIKSSKPPGLHARTELHHAGGPFWFLWSQGDKDACIKLTTCWSALLNLNYDQLGEWICHYLKFIVFHASLWVCSASPRNSNKQNILSL